jgi:ElaB/YqjD/DUF883 family membrane-anchored ribosome-binding protein
MEVEQTREMQRAALRKLGQDLRTLAADAEQLLLATGDAPSEEINAMRARAAQSLRELRDRIAAAEREVVGRARFADDYVHENPWRAIAMTGGVAFLVGRLFSRR